MDSQVEEIKRKVDIVSLISESVQLKKAGRNYKGLCPFHSEKTPSFMVNPERQIFKCFGCGEGGDVLSFVEKNERASFPEALKLLADRVGVKLKQTAPDPAEKQKDTFFKINAAAAELYHYILTKHAKGKQALEYLKARGIVPAAVKDFKLGFAPAVEGFVTGYLIKKGFSPAELIASGISLPSQRSKNPYDRFRGRIIFPIHDAQGRTVGFSGRILGSGEPKYLNSPDSLIFNKSNSLFGIDLARGEIGKSKKAILVEGNLDVVSSHQAGVTNTVCPLGTALTEAQVELIKRYAEEIVLAFDSDGAGISASKRAIELAENQGMAVRVSELGNFKDPDEMIRTEPKSWQKATEEATSVYEFIIASSLKRWSGQGVDGKRRVVAEVLPYLKGLTDPMQLEQYLQSLSDRLGVRIETVRSQLTVGAKTEQKLAEEPSPKRGTQLEEYLLALVLSSEKLEIDIAEAWFEKAETKALLSLFQEEFDHKGKLKVKEILKHLPESLTSKLDEVLLLTTRRCQKLFLKKQMQLLSLAIKQAEAAKEQERLTKLTNRFRDISQKLSTLDQSS